MSCICHECGHKYKVDILVDDDLWEQIKPNGVKLGCGLLCGSCICERIESIDEYAAYKMKNLCYQSNTEG